MSKWVCKLENVIATWPGREKTTLDHIELAPSVIEDHPMLPIMGPSGQGKSTLLYLLAALKWPSEGEITWTFPDGKKCSWGKSGLGAKKAAWLRRERFGFAFQDHTLSSHLTVLENIAYPLLLKGKSWKKAYQMAEKQLEMVLLKDEEKIYDDFIHSFPTQLSGGQQQRVALAQAMIHEPWVLFADEPTGQLDYCTRHQVMNVLKKWVKTDETKHRLIWVTHHHTDDLDLMDLNDFLFVEQGKCKLQHRSDLEKWKQQVNNLQQGEQQQ
ncbi:MAG: ATP-binding cassette domain-containing protein [Thiomargarita sp.]|nr:ATP-binding cassette domain-containing protein [Thiomargarita sp.]